MQRIDYNSSILTPFLSGINLACLDNALWSDKMACSSVGPFFIPVVLKPRSLHLLRTPDKHQNYLCNRSFFLFKRLIWLCFEVFFSSCQNQLNRVFRRSILSHRLDPPPSSTLWSIDSGRVDILHEQAQFHVGQQYQLWPRDGATDHLITCPSAPSINTLAWLYYVLIKISHRLLTDK